MLHRISLSQCHSAASPFGDKPAACSTENHSGRNGLSKQGGSEMPRRNLILVIATIVFIFGLQFCSEAQDIDEGLAMHLPFDE